MYLLNRVLSWFGYVILDDCAGWKDEEGNPCEYGYKYRKVVKERNLYKFLYERMYERKCRKEVK